MTLVRESTLRSYISDRQSPEQLLCTQDSLLQLVGMRSQAEPFAEYSKNMKFAKSCNLSKLCERDIADQMLVEIVSHLHQCGGSRSRSLRHTP